MDQFTLLLLLLLFSFSTFPAAKPSPLSSPFHPDRSAQQIHEEIGLSTLHNLMSRLRDDGFGYLAGEMNNMKPELEPLNNMTIFAVDDTDISNGSEGYMDRVEYHIVPNQLLMKVNLNRLQMGDTLPTLDRGQFLKVTSAGGIGTEQLMINYVSIKVPDVMLVDSKIVVQRVYKPFQRIPPV